MRRIDEKRSRERHAELCATMKKMEEAMVAARCGFSVSWSAACDLG